MATATQISMNEANCPVAESELAQVNGTDPQNIMEIGSKMPPMQRARLAQFCYHRKHMRELGLRLASMCTLPELKAAFGRGAEVIYQQTRDIEATVESMNTGRHEQYKKGISLAGKHGLRKVVG